MKPAQFFYFGLALTVAQLSSALPLVNIADTTANIALPTSFFERSDKCYQSSFTDETSGGSPWVSDCKWLVGRLKVDHYITRERKELVRYGNCRFMARTWEKSENAWLGSDDIEDLIRDSIAKFQKVIDGKNRVGARGKVPCNWPGSQFVVHWWIWRTP